MICKEHENQFIGVLRSKRLKATPARLGMLEVLAHQSRPVSIKELQVKVKPVANTVTLYRNAEALSNLGIINRIRLQDKKEYFEFAHKNHHHHLVCASCGKITDVTACQVEPISNQILKNAGFAKINNHQLEFFGVCNKCAR